MGNTVRGEAYVRNAECVKQLNFVGVAANYRVGPKIIYVGPKII